jgi:mannose-6-phosphate isomerase-like protein (cupin superfamily)
MTAGYRHITKPTEIPTFGGKIIEEIVGGVNTGSRDVSVAHMKSPPGWSEPAQTPEFAEITVMVDGTLRVELPDRVLDLKAGESLRVEPGVRVRYSNPSDRDNEYYAICIPAFSPDTVHRHEDE